MIKPEKNLIPYELAARRTLLRRMNERKEREERNEHLAIESIARPAERRKPKPHSPINYALRAMGLDTNSDSDLSPQDITDYLADHPEVFSYAIANSEVCVR